MDSETAQWSNQYVLKNYGRFPIAFERGEGGYLYDDSGREYLDFGTGIAVCSLGHCPEVMQEALREQGAKLIHCSNLYHIREQAELAKFVVETMLERPGKVFFCNSGAEANDSLIKFARKRAFDKFGKNSGKNEVITCQRSFHGRTLGGIAATGQDKVKIGFDPLLPGFLHVPLNDVEALEEAVTEKTAAILFEPLQGEGGIHCVSPEYFAKAAELREKHDLVLLFDEVQCGAGRTGDWCGWRTILRDTGVNVEPDAVSWAKGFGGGFPIGSIWISEEHADALGPGTHGSTFGGGPLASAVSLAVLNELENCGALENVSRQEQRIRETVASWESPLIESLRGVGLMLGFVLDASAFDAISGFQESGQTPALYLVNTAMNAGLLTAPAGPDVLRWLPRLNVTDAEVGQALEIFGNILRDLTSNR